MCAEPTTQYTDMDSKEFFMVVARMREAQKSGRDASKLEEAIDHEIARGMLALKAMERFKEFDLKPIRYERINKE